MPSQPNRTPQQVPNLNPYTVNPGIKSGVPGGTQTAVAVAQAQAQPSAPIKMLASVWRPGTFLDFIDRVKRGDQGASQDLEKAFSQIYNNVATLQMQIASTQTGNATVTGTAKGIPTGLTSVMQVTASVDKGTTPHNFTVSASPSQTPGAIDITVSQPTSASVTTAILATSAVPIRWIATGTVSA